MCKSSRRSYWTTDKIEGAALGMFVASVAFLVLFWSLDITTVADNEDLIVGLATVAGTVAGAYLAVWGIRKQIQDNRDIVNDAAEAELIASRAMLPLALTRLVSVCDNNVRRNYDHGDLLTTNPQATELHELDPQSIAILREAIKSASPANRERLAPVIRAYQVAFARSPSGPVPPARPSMTHVYMDHDRHLNAINWASVQAIAEKAFPYSRARAATIPSAAGGDVINAVKHAGLDFSIFPNLGLICDVRAAEGRLFVID